MAEILRENFGYLEPEWVEENSYWRRRGYAEFVYIRRSLFNLILKLNALIFLFKNISKKLKKGCLVMAGISVNISNCKLG
ncbi:MAG: hypothetical protein WC147_04405 [Syntrophomonas sp.]